MKSNYKYITELKFSDLSNWSVQYFNHVQFKYNDIYQLDKIGSFLKRNKTPIEIENDKYYKRATIKVRNGGVFLRDIEIGTKIGTKSQFLIKEGQFLLSKIDARNGAFGVVSSDLDNGIITGNFWTFDVDYTRVNPHFLSLIVTTKEFIEFCENASNGATNRHYLQEPLFLDIKVPLPSISIQNKLVDSYNKLIKKSEDCTQKADELEKEIERYLLDELGIEFKENNFRKGLQFIQYKELYIWGVDKLQKQNNKILNSKKYINKKLNSVVYINPKTNIKQLSDDNEISFIPMECISDIYGEVKEKRIGKKENSKGYTKFQNGDLIWARITPCMQNGKSAIADDLLNGYGYGSTEYHVIRKKGNDVSIDYIYHLLRMDVILKEAQNYFTGSAGQQRVPKTYLENLQIPIPPLEKQQVIVEHVSLLKKEIKYQRKEAEKNKVLALTQFENEIFG